MQRVGHHLIMLSLEEEKVNKQTKKNEIHIDFLVKIGK